MANYCVIKDTLAINRIVWNGVDTYTYQEDGVTLLASEIGQIADKYENSKFYYWNEDTQQWVERAGQ